VDDFLNYLLILAYLLLGMVGIGAVMAWLVKRFK